MPNTHSHGHHPRPLPGKRARQVRSGILVPALNRLLAPVLCLAAVSAASAAVVRVEVTERSDVAATGYEQIAGRLHFEIDPAHPRNRIIADADLVSYATDFLQPQRVDQFAFSQLESVEITA